MGGGNCSALAGASFANESAAFVAVSVGLAMVDAVSDFLAAPLPLLLRRGGR